MLRLLKLRPVFSASRRGLTPTTTNTPPPLPVPNLSIPPLFPQPQAHLLLRLLPVSSTPKGKARLKNITHLKKNSFQKNKRPILDPKTKRPILDAKQRRTLPLRLNARLRRREAIRQELGLQSKLHRLDLELRKAREDPPASAPPLMGLRGLDLADLGFVQGVPAFDLTVEDGRRLAKEYSRILTHWNRLRQKAEVGALQLMREAVEAMPEDLRKKALIPTIRKKRKMKVGAEGKRGSKAVASRKKSLPVAGKKGGVKGGKKG